MTISPLAYVALVIFAAIGVGGIGGTIAAELGLGRIGAVSISVAMWAGLYAFTQISG